MRASVGIPFYRQGIWIFSATLTVVQCMAWLAGAPYFLEGSFSASDEIMGAFFAFSFAILVYIIHLIIVTPLLVARLKKLGHKFGTTRDLWVFLPIIIPSAFFLLLFAASQNIPSSS